MDWTPRTESTMGLECSSSTQKSQQSISIVRECQVFRKANMSPLGPFLDSRADIPHRLFRIQIRFLLSRSRTKDLVGDLRSPLDGFCREQEKNIALHSFAFVILATHGSLHCVVGDGFQGRESVIAKFKHIRHGVKTLFRARVYPPCKPNIVS
jgi:hypothetical protein